MLSFFNGRRAASRLGCHPVRLDRLRAGFYPWPLRLVVLSCLFGGLTSCQRILGIETDRMPYTAYPDGGYKGCTKSPDCADCASPDHRCLCERGVPCSSSTDTATNNPGAGGGTTNTGSNKTGAGGSTSSTGSNQAGTGGGTSGVCQSDSGCQGCSSDLFRCLCQGGNIASCKAPSCEAAATNETCTKCMCGSCHDKTNACLGDAKCQELLGCIVEKSCDPAATDANGCFSSGACLDSLGRAGGRLGASYSTLMLMLDCGKAAQCACSKDACTPQNGCSCDGCLAKCKCQGRADPVCTAECATTTCVAPGCLSCADCYAQCKCRGNDDATCGSQCSAPICVSPSCSNCADCVAQCKCQGKSEVDCATTCGTVNSCSPPCGGCSDCWSRCTCQGKDQTTCNTECGSVSLCQYPSCGSCADCYAQCTCLGKAPADCTAQCSAAVCVSPNCTGCADCYTQCKCQGNADPICSSRCTSTSCQSPNCQNCGDCGKTCDCLGGDVASCKSACPAALCSNKSCGGCVTDFASCVCNGGSASDCDRQKICTMTNPCTCGNTVADCECSGKDTQTCANTYVGTCANLGLPVCERCICDKCTSLYDRCVTDVGCKAVLECVDAKGCVDAICLFSGTCRPVVDSHGGISASSVKWAEAVVGCRNNACTNACAPAQTIACSTTQCSSVATSKGRLLPCCPPTTTNVCGLDLSVLTSSSICVPLNAPGKSDAACPPLNNPGESYPSGTTLSGCCRSDNTCGYRDDTVLRLGCAPPQAFGLGVLQTCVY
jgi:hypothetical protein